MLGKFDMRLARLLTDTPQYMVKMGIMDGLMYIVDIYIQKNLVTIMDVLNLL